MKRLFALFVVLAFGICFESNLALSALVFKSEITSSRKTSPTAFSNPRWEKKCRPDKGSVIKKGQIWTLKTSKNSCDGGTFAQRAEIDTGAAISSSHVGKYVFESKFKLTSDANNKFSILSVNDGRSGCAMPLQIFVSKTGYLSLTGDYKYGTGLACDRDVLNIKYTFKEKVLRDGTEQILRVYLDFKGNSKFGVVVYLNDELVATTAYQFPEGKGFYKSQSFSLSHGVYSHKMFDYVMETKVTLAKD